MKLKATLLLSTLALSTAAFAQTKAPEPDYTLSFNAGVVTDYRYRGISQTRLKPAVQGGLDFAHKSGFYLGAWASTIKWIEDSGSTDGKVELDLYGGYKGELTRGLAYDVGVLRYEYVGNKLGNVANYANANTTEVYGALTAGVFTAKYSRSLTNLFGTANSKNSGYLDLSATFDVAGISVTPHVGRQIVNNSSAASYTDYSLLASKAFGAVTLSAGVVGMNGSKTLYVTPAGKFTGKNMVVAGVKYSF